MTGQSMSGMEKICFKGSKMVNCKDKENLTECILRKLIVLVAVLALLMMCFNMLGDGLRDAFDPKMKQM